MLRPKGGLIGAVVLAVLVALFLAGCSGQPLTTREKGTLAGGALGAGTGAIIGAAVGAPGAGAAIGGALGAAGGALAGNELQNQETLQEASQARLEEQQKLIDQQRRELRELKRQQALE